MGPKRVDRRVTLEFRTLDDLTQIVLGTSDKKSPDGSKED